MANIQLTQALLRELFYYKNGFLYWIKSPNGRVKSGAMAGTLHSGQSGIRRVIKIHRKQYAASRLIFLHQKGYLPIIVDHKDRNTINDKINNLRDANKSQNCKNRASRKNSTSKYLGVCIRPNGKWYSQIIANNKVKHLGSFNTQQEAAIAYNNAATKYHGEFANLNIIQ